MTTFRIISAIVTLLLCILCLYIMAMSIATEQWMCAPICLLMSYVFGFFVYHDYLAIFIDKAQKK